MPRVSSVARASSTSEPARETPRAAQPSVERLRPVWMLLLRWSRLLHDGIRPRSSSKPRPRALPFADGSFDAAVGNIVIQHIGEPERAALELVRVLVSGGRVALSTWDAPERSPFFATILGAVADADVPPPAGIPAGPSFFQFADDVVFAALLRDAGFTEVQVDAISFEVPLGSAEDLVAGLVEGTVRTGALLRAADEAQGALIRESLEVRLEPWRRGASYAVPASVKIASGTKPVSAFASTTIGSSTGPRRRSASRASRARRRRWPSSCARRSSTWGCRCSGSRWRTAAPTCWERGRRGRRAEPHVQRAPGHVVLGTRAVARTRAGLPAECVRRGRAPVRPRDLEHERRARVLRGGASRVGRCRRAAPRRRDDRGRLG